MATHADHYFGSPARLILTGRPRSRSIPVAPAATRPMPEPSVQDHGAPKHYPSDMGIFESARMSRELGRETPQSLQSQKSANPILSALMNMSNRRFLVLLAGVALIAFGLLALRFPVFLPDFDQWGVQINCGSGFESALTQASAADSGGTNFVDQCHTAVAERRAWTIPVTMAGVLLLGALMVRAPRRHSPAAQPEYAGAAPVAARATA
jgi:hypothetical protein